MKVPLYTKEGKKKQEVVLNPEVFGVRVNARLLEMARNAYSANLRRGTAHTKTRGEVRGGGKKPWRQKGTGNARVAVLPVGARWCGMTLPEDREITVAVLRELVKDGKYPENLWD